MTDGIGNRAAARLIGCTHGAIAKAIESGHLRTLPNGKISPAALEKWNAGRRAERRHRMPVVSGSAAKPVSTRGTTQREVQPVPSSVAGLASMAECCPSDVAMALLPYLSDEMIKPIHDRLLSEWRAAAAELADEDYTPPAGMASWSQHPQFNAPVELDFDELRSDAAL